MNMDKALRVIKISHTEKEQDEGRERLKLNRESEREA